jgi:hypothetical protein
MALLELLLRYLGLAEAVIQDILALIAANAPKAAKPKP